MIEFIVVEGKFVKQLLKMVWKRGQQNTGKELLKFVEKKRKVEAKTVFKLRRNLFVILVT